MLHNLTTMRLKTEVVDGEATLTTKFIQKEKIKTVTDVLLYSQRALSGKQELL